MSQLTEFRVNGVLIIKKINETCKDLWQLANDMVAKLNINKEVSERINQLEKMLLISNHNNKISLENFKKQVSKVTNVMNNEAFTDLSSYEKQKIENALLLKCTDMNQFVSMQDVSFLQNQNNYQKNQDSWELILDKAKNNILKTQLDHSLNSFRNICEKLGYAEVTQKISYDASSFIKFRNTNNGQGIVITTEPDDSGISCVIDLAGFDPRTNECQVVQKKLLKGLEKEGIILSNTRVITHNNPKGVVILNLKKHTRKVMDFINGRLSKSMNNNQKNRIHNRNNIN